jgi:hypothetical protein
MTQELQLLDIKNIPDLKIVKAYQTSDDQLYLQLPDAIKHQTQVHRIDIIKTVLEDCLNDYRFKSDWVNHKLIDEIIGVISHLSDADIKKIYSTIEEN